MSKNVVIAAVVIIVLILAGWYFTRPKSTTPEVSQPAPTASQSASASPSAVTTAKNMVSITANGYAPNSLTIKAGESVTWTNNDSADHTVNSDPHPTHTLYPFLNLGVIKPGDSKSATFEKVGTYTYHDHLNPSNKGTVTVE